MASILKIVVDNFGSRSIRCSFGIGELSLVTGRSLMESLAIIARKGKQRQN